MSEVRVALVCEGTTDVIVIKAALSSVLGGRNFLLVQLQPEAVLGRTGTGWPGVYRWCRLAADQGGGRALSDNPSLESFDIIVVHLDADVADETYGSGSITEPVQDLPCRRPCPPPSDTTDPLRQVLLRWLGEAVVPQKAVFCTPSKSTEAWVLAALYPADTIVRSGLLECRQSPADLLSGKPARGRLVKSGKKQVQKYQDRAADIEANWTAVRGLCSEAERFSTDFLLKVPIAA